MMVVWLVVAMVAKLVMYWVPSMAKHLADSMVMKTVEKQVA
jgi:hypothetical protein